MLKKYVSLVLALSLLTSCAAPAGPSPEPSSAASPSREILAEEEGAEKLIRVILDSQSNGESYHPLSAEDTEFYLSEVYGIPKDSRGGAALIYTLGGVEAREIAVLYGTTSIQSNTAAAALERYRKNRLADFSGYVPDQAALVEKGLVLEGNAALLVICADPDAAQKALEGELSYLALKPYDPGEELPEPYDWTDYVNDKGWRLFEPPNKFDMTPYDTSAILTAWETGDTSGLEKKDASYYGDLQGEELMASTHRYFNVTSDYMRETDHQWDYDNVPEATATRYRWDGKSALPS